MLDKCLNPVCSAKFRTLRDGRVFVKEVDGGGREGNGSPRSHKLAYFWLCGSCCRTMTVIVQDGKGVRAMPLPSPCAISENHGSAESTRKDHAEKETGESIL